MHGHNLRLYLLFSLYFCLGPNAEDWGKFTLVVPLIGQTRSLLVVPAGLGHTLEGGTVVHVYSQLSWMVQQMKRRRGKICCIAVGLITADVIAAL